MKRTIINLTQHIATPEQLAAGVMDLNEAQRKQLHELLTFDELPSYNEMNDAAANIAKLASKQMPDAEYAMIGGAPFFMSVLEVALSRVGIDPIYAFSKRESVEKRMSDGSVVKSMVFKHLGFVET